MRKFAAIPISLLILSLAIFGGALLYLRRVNIKIAPVVVEQEYARVVEQATVKLSATTTTPEYVSELDFSASSTLSTAPQMVTIIAVGDIMLSRNVAAKIKKYNDFNYPFASTSVFLKSADAVFGNLESPITPGPIVPTGSFTFHADPGAEAALAAANFKILSLANNHLPNYGATGIADTIEYLNQVGIAHAGAGQNLAEANLPALVQVKGIKFAFLAYNDSDVVPPGYGAAISRAGTALMDITKMKEAVSLAKKQADLLIVSMHSGSEYTEVLTKSQTEFAHAAIDAGAELVLGHHPHVTQRVEKYKDKYIFYSLGNFIFDQMWSEETRRGLAVKFYFNQIGLVRAEVTPLVIMDYARPVVTEQKTAEEIYRRLRIEPNESLIKLMLAN